MSSPTVWALTVGGSGAPVVVPVRAALEPVELPLPVEPPLLDADSDPVLVFALGPELPQAVSAPAAMNAAIQKGDRIA